MGSDPWEIAAALLEALDEVESSWKVDHSAPGAYVRLPISVQRRVAAARRIAPHHLRRLRKVGGQPIIDATPAEVKLLRDTTAAVLEHSVPMSEQAIVVRASDVEAMQRALNVLQRIETDARNSA